MWAPARTQREEAIEWGAFGRGWGYWVGGGVLDRGLGKW